MDILKIILISAAPLSEQRLAIYLGIHTYELDPILVMIFSFLGSLLPVPFILFFFNIIFEWMKRFKFFRIINNYIENKLDRGSKKIEKYKEIGLIILVAIPLPTTGLWTGSAVAAFLKLDIKKSFMYIAIGGVISAVVITILSVTFPSFVKSWVH